MNVILGATEEMQEAPKEHRRGEFLKGFSYLMGIYISTFLSAFAWFDPDTRCQSAHCECYCCWPCPQLILLALPPVCQMRTPFALACHP